VIFFDVALILALASAVIVGRSRMTYLLVAIVPAIVLAELLTQRRVAFIALLAAFLVVAHQLWTLRRRVMTTLLVTTVILAIGYGAAFWNAQGAIAQPLRAVKSVVSPDSISDRDRLSNYWRDIENVNIAYTLRQFPVTGVGLGQQYLFKVEPPALTGFTYWRYMTHNAIFWIWLKSGIVGFLAFWSIFALTIVEAARLVRVLRDPELKILALMPVALVISTYVYASVDLGLTYSRPTIVLGAVLGSIAALAAQVPREPEPVRVMVARARSVLAAGYARRATT
jgi:hypothetical protein